MLLDRENSATIGWWDTAEEQYRSLYSPDRESITAGQDQKFYGVVKAGASNFSVAMGW